MISHDLGDRDLLLLYVVGGGGGEGGERRVNNMYKLYRYCLGFDSRFSLDVHLS